MLQAVLDVDIIDHNPHKEGTGIVAMEEGQGCTGPVGTALAGGSGRGGGGVEGPGAVPRDGHPSSLVGAPRVLTTSHQN